MKLYFKNLVNYSFCFFLLLSLIIVSCKEKSQSLSETLNTETKLALSKDQDFITYSKVSKDFREKVSVDYYGYNKIDKSILNKELQTVKNDADFIKAYEKAGLNNAKEFVEYQMIQGAEAICPRVQKRFVPLHNIIENVSVTIFGNKKKKQVSE